MPLYKTKAVVLRALLYGEVDRIVTLYTLDFGKVKGFAKGAKRSQKRFGNALEIASYVTVAFFEKEAVELVRLGHCELIAPFAGLRGDIGKLAAASYLIELVEALTAERIQNKPLFRLLVFFLNLIDKGALQEEVMRIFEIRLFSLLGYQPQFGSCRGCRKELTEGKIFFGPREGGVLCPSCAETQPGLVPLAMGTVKTLHMAQTLPLEKVSRLSFSPRSLKESEAILSAFLNQYLGKPLKSKKFLEEL